MTEIAIIVLAAGLGTRMRSELPKVLHKAAGRSLLGHVLTAAKELKPAHCVVVCGPGKEDLTGEAKRYVPGAEMVTQAERARHRACGFHGRGQAQGLCGHDPGPLWRCAADRGGDACAGSSTR